MDATSEENPTIPLPHMSMAEIECFKTAICRKTKMMEFGAGGSTLLCIQEEGVSLVSVECDKNWINKLSEFRITQTALSEGRLHFHHADIGPTGEWGNPVGDSAITRWPNYWKDVWKEQPQLNFDCIFVDGRFRVACTLFAITKLQQDTTIIIHDFWSRDYYHIILKYLTCIATTDDLAIFCIKPNIDFTVLVQDLAEHVLDYR